MVTVNPEVPGSILGLGTGNFGNLLVVFPAISDRVDCISNGLRCQEAVYLCYTPGTLKNQTVYSIRARRTMPDMSVSNFCVFLLGALSHSVPLVRSLCICTGRGCTCAHVAAILCKAPLNVFDMKIYKSGIMIINNNFVSSFYQLILQLHCNRAFSISF